MIPTNQSSQVRHYDSAGHLPIFNIFEFNNSMHFLLQGTLECWVDIMRPEEALAYSCEDISLPPEQVFEVFSL
jgi:hypothetical protein